MANQTMFQTLCSESHLLNAWKDIKNKGSVGGIDGQSLADFEKDLGDNILEIIERLKCGRWSPMPYKQIEIPKKLLVRNITERMYKRENYRGENLPFETIIRQQAKEIADFFEDNSGYKPYKAKW